MSQMQAETAYFTLREAQSFRFRNLPTTKALDLVKGQVIRVTHPGDIAYFRARPQQVVECGPEGIGINEPAPGTITAPNAKTKRIWPNSPLHRSMQPPGTRAVGQPFPAAANPTGQHAVSQFSQMAPGYQQPNPLGVQRQVDGAPTLMPAPVPAPQPLQPPHYGAPTGYYRGPATGHPNLPQPPAPAAPGAPVKRISLGRVVPTARPQPAQTPQVLAGPAPVPLLPTEPQTVTTPNPDFQVTVDESMHPGASAEQASEPLAEQPAVATEPVEPTAEASAPVVAPQPPQSLPAPATPATPVAPTQNVDPAYLAQPIPPGGLAQRPQVTTPAAQAPQVTHPAQMPAFVNDTPGQLGLTANHSQSVAAMASGRGVPDASHAKRLLAGSGNLGAELNTPIETPTGGEY